MSKKKIRIKLPKINILKHKRVLYFVYAILIVVSGYHIIFAKRIIPGVKVGSVVVGGLTYDQALNKLQASEKNLGKEIKLTFDEDLVVLSAEDIGLVYDWEASTSRAFEVGRTGNIFSDSKEKVAGLIKGVYVGAFYDYDDEVLKNKFASISGEINVSAVDADFGFDGPDLVITPSQIGSRVMDDALFKMVVSAFDHMDFSVRRLPVEIAEPAILEDDLAQVLEDVTTVVFNDLSVTYTKDPDKKPEKWILNRDQLLDFLGFSKKKDGTLDLKLNEPKFEAFVDTLSQEINMLPRGKVTAVDGEKVVQFEIIQEGSELDVKTFTEKFKNAYFKGLNTVEVVMKDISGPARKEDYGIFALLGEGKSKFTGSAQARINNLTLAAERTNGVLVPPGGIYSMNNSVGDISKATGYDTAYIIKEGRTVLGEGGGVCQTSTTLFRAVLNSGLPVVMRYPHAYRVYYYEIESPVGIDATIYQPSIDFQFKNDTPNYVLVQSEANLEEKSLTFRIYGTPDGRSTEISEPVVTNQVPPPEPLYQDDPTLDKGVVKQVDFAAWGATASFTRVVSRGDDILLEDKYTTRYQPWQAVYLVGTKD